MKALKNILKHLPAVALLMVAALSSCTIQPPLNLADRTNTDIYFPEVITDIEVIWDIDANWRDGWWYGWDAEDIRQWGTLDYPNPSNYEVRIFHKGDNPYGGFLDVYRNTVFGNRFTRHFQFGYHDLVIWSNIDSDDFSQVLVIDESDLRAIYATTSRASSVGYPLPSRAPVYNNPEIFYGNQVENFLLTDDYENDYDYYDAERKVWVKYLKAELYPLVYTYLVQVVVYNNNGKIVNMREDPIISSLADGVTIPTGHTSMNDVNVTYPMRMKHDLPARNGRHADIFGGKLTTFGLCDMESWARSRANTRYSGSRGDLINYLSVDFNFRNSIDKVMSFDVTDQIQRQIHGGIITIEIDADTVQLPVEPPPPGGSPAGGFDPVVAPPEQEEHEFGM